MNYHTATRPTPRLRNIPAKTPTMDEAALGRAMRNEAKAVTKQTDFDEWLATASTGGLSKVDAMRLAWDASRSWGASLGDVKRAILELMADGRERTIVDMTRALCVSEKRIGRAAGELKREKQLVRTALAGTFIYTLGERQ